MRYLLKTFSFHPKDLDEEVRKGNFGSILPNAKENKEELEMHQPQIHSQFHSQSVRIIRGADGVRGRSQFSTFSQAYTQYTRGEGGK